MTKRDKRGRFIKGRSIPDLTDDQAAALRVNAQEGLAMLAQMEAEDDAANG
jgi:hypothetical protein